MFKMFPKFSEGKNWIFKNVLFVENKNWWIIITGIIFKNVQNVQKEIEKTITERKKIEIP